jgi:hypothetical protein
VPVIRGFDQLSVLLREFAVYYNEHRGHARLGGARPVVVYRGEQTLPITLERRIFADTKTTAYRLAAQVSYHHSVAVEPLLSRILAHLSRPSARPEPTLAAFTPQIQGPVSPS